MVWGAPLFELATATLVKLHHQEKCDTAGASTIDLDA